MPAVSAVVAGVSIASSVFGFGRKRKAAKRTRRINELQQEQADIANVQARQQAAAVIRRQEAVAAAQALGAGSIGSSSQAATTSSLAAQGQVNDALQLQGIGFQNATRRNQRAINRFNNQASLVQGFADIASVGLQSGLFTGGKADTSTGATDPTNQTPTRVGDNL